MADEGSLDISDGIKDINNGMKNNNQSKIKQGLNKIQQGANKLNQAQQNAGVNNNQSGQQASQDLQQGIDKIDNSLNNQQQNSKSQQGQQGSQGQQNQANQGQGSQSGSEQGSSSQSQGQGGSSQGQGSQDSGDDVLADSNNQSQQNTNQGQGTDDLSNDNSFNNKVRDIEVTYNGKKLKGKIIDDIMSNHEAEQQKNLKERMEESKQALQNIKTKQEMDKQQGKSISCGTGGGLVQRHIDFGLSQGVDWRTLLHNVCKREKKKMYTLSKPNRTYMQMGRTVSSRQTIGNNNKLKDIKICIDVSGSVEQEDLNKYMSEINNIFRHYDVDGELIYWSTEIGSVGNFSELKDLLKIQPNTTGGTDVKCVFDYLSGKTKFNNKFEETKLRDISCVLIITDGCFSKNYASYERYFGKKTIWLIDGSIITFDRAFGKVVSLVDENAKH